MTYISNKRLFVTEDRSTVVAEDDPRARFLLVGEGGELPDAVAAQYGLIPSTTPGPQPDDAPTGGKAVASPPHTKAVAAPKGSK